MLVAVLSHRPGELDSMERFLPKIGPMSERHGSIGTAR